MNLSGKTALLATHGQFVSQAVRLARDFETVLLWVADPVGEAYKTIHRGRIGSGLPGVTLVDSIFGPHLDQVDLFVFPDIFFADEQLTLEEQGKRVWGSRNGAELEIYRDLAKQAMEQTGYPVQPWAKLTGIAALREHLKAHENQYVKLNRWRGHSETFPSRNYRISQVRVDQLAHDLGPYQDHEEFVAEDEIPDAVEIGLDTYCIDGKFPGATLLGIEVKDLGYVGEFRAWEEIPEPIRRWHETMAPLLAKYGYRGDLTNELRITADHTPYMIDATCRSPTPPSELVQEFYENWSQIRFAGGDGQLVDPRPAGKFGVEIMIRSRWAEQEWQPVQVPEQFERNVKLFNESRIGDTRYVPPQGEEMSGIGALVGWGETLEEAVKMAHEASDSIEAFGLEIPEGSLDRAREEMDKLNRSGLKAFSKV